MITFTAKIEKDGDAGAWHYVLLPTDALKQLRDVTGKRGSVKVHVTIGKTTYATTMMSRGNQQWFLAVKAAVRNAENLAEGDTVTIIIKPEV